MLDLVPCELGVRAGGVYVVDDDERHVLAGPFTHAADALAWIEANTRRSPVSWLDQVAKVLSAARFSGRLSHFVSKRPIWLAEAAEPVIARSPTTQRIAGSRHSLSASFTSSYPASRPNTDWRSKPARR